MRESLRNFFRTILNKFKNKNLFELYKIFVLIFLKIIIKKYYKTIDTYRSESDNGFYLHITERANNNFRIFQNFRNHPIFIEIYEHVSKSQGKEYLDYIIKNDKNLLDKIDKFLENDKIGNPKKYYYEEIDKLISPTTLRYIKVASDIKKNFQIKLIT